MRQAGFDGDFQTRMGSRNPIAEIALWSSRGTWGLLVSHEQHVVIGGSNEFVTQLLTHVHDADEQVASFIQDVGHYASDIEGRPPDPPGSRCS
jgi:hypothetical protein